MLLPCVVKVRTVIVYIYMNGIYDLFFCYARIKLNKMMNTCLGATFLCSIIVQITRRKITGGKWLRINQFEWIWNLQQSIKTCKTHVCVFIINYCFSKDLLHFCDCAMALLKFKRFDSRSSAYLINCSLSLPALPEINKTAFHSFSLARAWFILFTDN